jgi:hypothetical protein
MILPPAAVRTVVQRPAEGVEDFAWGGGAWLRREKKGKEEESQNRKKKDGEKGYKRERTENAPGV